MTNEKVAANWWSGIDSRASSMFSERGVLYSYGRHWPLAVRRGDVTYVNCSLYSNTTGRHRYLATSVVSNKIVHVTKDMMLRIVDGYTPTVRDIITVPEQLNKSLTKLGLKLSNDLNTVVYGTAIMRCEWYPDRDGNGPTLFIISGGTYVGTFPPKYRCPRWNPLDVIR